NLRAALQHRLMILTKREIVVLLHDPLAGPVHAGRLLAAQRILLRGRHHQAQCQKPGGSPSSIPTRSNPCRMPHVPILLPSNPVPWRWLKVSKSSFATESRPGRMTCEKNRGGARRVHPPESRESPTRARQYPEMSSDARREPLASTFPLDGGRWPK